MKSCRNDGKYDASHHVEHIKQMASLQAQLRDHQRHLQYHVGDKLDDCLVMLADGHDQVMNAMIGVAGHREQWVCQRRHGTSLPRAG